MYATPFRSNPPDSLKNQTYCTNLDDYSIVIAYRLYLHVGATCTEGMFLKFDLK